MGRRRRHNEAPVPAIERPAPAELSEIRGAYLAEFPEHWGLAQKDWWQGFRLRAERSLYVFAKFVLGMRARPGQPVGLSPTLHRQVCDWIQCMDKACEHEMTPSLTVHGGKRKLLMLPVVHLKTTLVSHSLPLHMLAQPQAHNIYFPGMPGADTRILLHGETVDKARENLGVIKENLERNHLLRWLWPHLIWREKKEAPTWKDDAITVRRSGQRILPEPTITAIGVRTALEQRHYDCVAPGTMVYTSNGLLAIQALEIGNRVLTHTGHHREVVAIAQRRSDKRRVRLRVWGQPEELVCTEDHRLLAYRENRLEWVEAGQLQKGEYLALALPSGRTRAVSRINARIDRLLQQERVWRLLGYWLAEGAASDKNRIRLTFGAHETDLANDAKAIVEDYLGVNCHISDPTPTSTVVVSFFDAEFKLLTGKFGTHAWNKHLPPFALSTERSYQRELLRGYFTGDGAKLARNGWAAGSASRSLLAGIQLLLALQGIPSGIGHSKYAGQELVVGNLVNRRDYWALVSNHPLMGVLLQGKAEFPRMPCRTVVIPGYLLHPIRRIDHEEPDDEPVWDIQVRGDESFCTPGITAHNCILMDDLATLEAAQSENVMNYAKTRRKACRSRLDSLRDSMEIGVGTHWTATDLYVDWKRDPSVEVCLRAAIEDELPIWPEKHPLEELLALQAEEQMGKVLFSANYMNQPLNPGFSALDWQEIRAFTYDPLDKMLAWNETLVDRELEQRNNIKGLVNANLYALHGRSFRGMPLSQLYRNHSDEPIETKEQRYERRLARVLRLRDLEDEGSATWARLNELAARRQAGGFAEDPD